MSESETQKGEKPAASEPSNPSKSEGESILPPPGSIISEESFTSPSGQHYRIIHTDETDAHDRPEPAGRKRKATPGKAASDGDDVA